jgi:hypothetical protein
MPAPTNITTPRFFLGLVNYYQSLVRNMLSIRKPFSDLLQKDNEWKWSVCCQEAFDSIKCILISDLLLIHYDPSLELIVAAEASEHGLGTAIQYQWPDGSVTDISHA